MLARLAYLCINLCMFADKQQITNERYCLCNPALDPALLVRLKPHPPAPHRLHPANFTPRRVSPKMGESSFNAEAVPSQPAFNLTTVDKWILEQTNETFKKHDWEDLRRIIESNKLEDFKRTPTELRKYLEWTAGIKAQYGSITEYLMTNRLPAAWGRPPFTPTSTVPLAAASDYTILLNDWPYALAPGITHIIVWTRTRIPADDDKGDLLPESRRLIGDFVQRTFVDELGPGGADRVQWFKNWVALQSVRALEHFHVLVKDVDHDTLEKWTGERPKGKRPWEE